MADELYDIGDVVEITADFNGETPTTLALEVRAPSGTITTYPDAAPEIIEDAPGDYHLDFVPTAAGQWRYEWRSTGAAQAAERGDFEVRERISATGDLTTVAAVRKYLQKPGADSGQDELIASLIAHASEVIRNHTRREFVGPVAAVERAFPYEGRLVFWKPFDLREVVTVTLDTDLAVAAQTVLSADDYSLYPRTVEEVYTHIKLAAAYAAHSEREVTIEGRWGFPKVPADVEQACVITVHAWIRRDVSAFSTTFNLDEGHVERPEAIPRAALGLLAPYTRRSLI